MNIAPLAGGAERVATRRYLAGRRPCGGGVTPRNHICRDVVMVTARAILHLPVRRLASAPRLVKTTSRVRFGETRYRSESNSTDYDVTAATTAALSDGHAS